MKLSVILPTFNEAGNISKLIKLIESQDELKDYKCQYVVVDDNSEDNTQAEVKKLIDKNFPVVLTVRKKERGLASAILRGIEKADGSFIVIMDTDLNHRPEDIPRLLKPIINNQADLVIGSRYIPGGGMHITEASQLQYWFSRWGNFFVRHWLNLPVSESLSGFLIIKKEALDKLPLKFIFRGYGEYCMRLLHCSNRLGYKIKEVPIMYGLRQYGVSKSSIKRMIYFYFKTAVELRFLK